MLKKNKAWIKVMGLLMGTIFFVLYTENGYAADEANNPLAFEVKPILTEEQIQRGIDYFYLQVSPNETKQISFEVVNNVNESAKFKLQFNRAATNRNGFLDYSLTKQKASKDLEVDFNNLFTSRELEVEVPANDRKLVTVDLAIPSKPFKGIVLGGVYITKIVKDDTSNNQKKKEGIEIEQRLAYATAVMLQEEVPYTGIPDLKLNGVSVSPLDNQAMLLLNLENNKPNILNKTSVKVDVYQSGKKELYSSLEKENLNFAPNSLFDLAFPWEQKLMVAGDYLAKITAKSGEKEWTFEQKFSISDEKLKVLKKEGDPLLQSQRQPILLYGVLGIAALIIVLLGFLLLKRK